MQEAGDDLGLDAADGMMDIPGLFRVAGGAILWKAATCFQVGPCGSCEELCPTGVLGLETPGHLGEKAPALRYADCIRCRLCLVTCPAGALTLSPGGAFRN
jgi:formate hydrogenlyase subunit 6/NADH:ubiquinone oxidoreductase subunit I